MEMQLSESVGHIYPTSSHCVKTLSVITWAALEGEWSAVQAVWGMVA